MVIKLVKDLWTIVRFHLLDHTYLAEESFIILSDLELSNVRNHPIKNNIENALKYASADYIIPLVKEYLQGRINQWSETREKIVRREIDNYNLALDYERAGNIHASHRHMNLSLIEKKRRDFQTSAIEKSQELLQTLDEGLEVYVKAVENVTV